MTWAGGFISRSHVSLKIDQKVLAVLSVPSAPSLPTLETPRLVSTALDLFTQSQQVLDWGL